MKDLKWTDAIIKVLHEEQRPLHYTEIAQLVAERGYRKSLGATPQDTVSAQITTDIKKNGLESIYKRLAKGIYTININENIEKKAKKEKGNDIQLEDLEKFELEIDELFEDNNTLKRIVSAFGIHWDRKLVEWKSKPHLYGIQLQGATEVNFQSQVGIYLLHDARETIYVGQAIKQSLGERLRQHTLDRLSGRWDRFSWFGFYPVKADGSLDQLYKMPHLTIDEMGDLIEALFIEALEPRLNRKQGNQFYLLEYLQKEDENITKKKEEDLIRNILNSRK